ncbi:MAG: NFACT RNA binding domain-containing protein [Candidatus Micrarchaeia archaeon]
MEARIDITKSAQENAQDYFSMSKKARRKKSGAEAAIAELKQKLKEYEDKEKQQPSSKAIRKISSKEWYEKFHWFIASNGMLVIGGRDAQQNEQLNSRYFDAGDLFFHADIFGASVVIMKNGESASREAKEEAAQFAACHSRAWEQGLSSADVYAAKRSQVSKSKEHGSLSAGSFLISGEREWFKGSKLELCAFVSENKINASESLVSFVPSLSISVDAKGINIAPSLTVSRLNILTYIKISPGEIKKSDAAKLIARKFKFDDIDYLMQQLPAGSFSLKEI